MIDYTLVSFITVSHHETADDGDLCVGGETEMSHWHGRLGAFAVFAAGLLSVLAGMAIAYFVYARQPRMFAVTAVVDLIAQVEQVTSLRQVTKTMLSGQMCRRWQKIIGRRILLCCLGTMTPVV